MIPITDNSVLTSLWINYPAALAAVRDRSSQILDLRIKGDKGGIPVMIIVALFLIR